MNPLSRTRGETEEKRKQTGRKGTRRLGGGGERGGRADAVKPGETGKKEAGSAFGVCTPVPVRSQGTEKRGEASPGEQLNYTHKPGIQRRREE